MEAEKRAQAEIDQLKLELAAMKQTKQVKKDNPVLPPTLKFVIRGNCIVQNFNLLTF